MKLFKKTVSLFLVVSLLMATACSDTSSKKSSKKHKDDDQEEEVETTKKPKKTEETEETIEDVIETEVLESIEELETSEATLPSETEFEPPLYITALKDYWADTEISTVPLLDSNERFYYTLDIALDTSNDTVTGQVEILFYNYSEDDWNNLCLRDYSSFFSQPYYSYATNTTGVYGGLTEISDVSIGYNDEFTPLECMRDEEDPTVLWFDLEDKIEPNEKAVLKYTFTAVIPQLGDRYGVCDGYYNVTNFYPILAIYENGDWSHEGFVVGGECFYSNVSDYQVTLTVPADFEIATTGVIYYEEEAGDNKILYIDAPCVRDFVFSGSPDFVLEERVIDGVNIRLLYKLTDSYSYDVVETSFNCAQESLEVFGEAYGYYPYGELDIVASDLDYASGMEYPNLVLIAVMSTRDEYQNVVCHEIAHQWFMGIVGSNSGIEPWLDESMASYSEVTYFVNASGADSATADLMDIIFEYIDIELLSSYDYVLPITQSYYEFSDDNEYVLSIYGVGQYGLIMMEKIIGRDTFYEIIHEYVERNSFHNTTTADFLDVVYEYMGTENEELNELIELVWGY
ncbi:MAG: M1 family metallopeptidase [Clostridia bacterium]|nr:M1 family metallopeptidase [Clostridia bacterium]